MPRLRELGGHEVAARAHRVHEVEDDLLALERRGEALGLLEVAADDLDLIGPGSVGEPAGIARERAHPVPGEGEPRDEPPADVARRAGDEHRAALRLGQPLDRRLGREPRGACVRGHRPSIAHAMQSIVTRNPQP